MAVLNTNQRSDVLVQELNLSQVITGASSSIAAQAIVAKQGRLTPQRFTNGTDYMTEYGPPTASVSFDVYAGLDYFREGSDLWGVRVAGAGYMYACVLMYDDGGVTKLVGVGVADPEDPDWDAITPTNGEAIALYYANKGPGGYGNDYALQIVSSNVEQPTGVAAVSSNTGGTLVAATYEYLVGALTPNGGETLASAPVQVIITGSATTNKNTITWPLQSQSIGYNVYGRTTAGVGFIAQVGAGTSSFVDTGAIAPVTARQPITDVEDAAPAEPTFVLNIFDTSVNGSTPRESFVCSLTSMTDGSGADSELEARLNPFSQYLQVTSNVATLTTVPDVHSVVRTNLVGGNSGAAPTAFDVAAAWAVFSDTELYDVNILINGGHSQPEVQLVMDALAQSRGDAIAVLDVPSARQQFQSAIDYRRLDLNLNSSYSALFAPDVLEADTINGKQQYVPFSGWAAALCARTDRVANPSFSIAGLNRGLVGVLKTRYTYDPGQQTAMFQAQVNYTRTFIGQGIALWEQQTLSAQQSALSWLSVRRIVNVIKKSLYQFLLYSLQEPNDDFTGRQIVGSCSDYLETVKNARGITAYSVVSDSSNNTTAMFNSAIRRVTVLIIPTLPIHIIDLQVVIGKQGVSFDELLSAANAA